MSNLGVRNSVWGLLKYKNDLLARSQFPHPHQTLTISVQIWTNFETYISKKWGGRVIRIFLLWTPACIIASWRHRTVPYFFDRYKFLSLVRIYFLIKRSILIRQFRLSVTSHTQVFYNDQQ